MLLSGGASALLAAPVDGVTLEDKVATARALMRGGLAIGELNCVRKHLSAVKGGRLSAAAGNTVTLAISDVHGPIADDPSVIGSGPTVADPTTFAQALAIVRGVERVPVSRAHASRARRPWRCSRDTNPAPDARFGTRSCEIIGNRQTALEGRGAAARELGYVCR